MVPVSPSNPSLQAPEPPLAKRRRGAWRKLGAWVTWALALVVIVLALAWAVVQWGILPNLDRWREPIEQQATRLLGAPVNIGAIRAVDAGLLPRIELDDVVIHDPAQREALHLRRVSAALSPRSVLTLRPHFRQLLVTGAMLDVRRDAQGRVLVAGIDINQAQDPASDNTAVDWLFAQPDLAIRQASVRWTDEKRGAPPLTLEAVDLVFRNRLTQHDVQLDATPPASWGERFSLSASFSQPLLAPNPDGGPGLASAGDWKTWSGTVHAHLPQADLAQLRQHVQLPFELNSGRGSLKASFDVARGNLQGAKAEVVLRDVDVRLAQELEPLDIQSLEGRLLAKRETDSVGPVTTLGVEGLTFQTKDGQTWPRGDVRLMLRGSPREPTSGELQAQRIDLSVLSLMATRLPLGASTRGLINQLQPAGFAERFFVSWDGPLDALKGWRMNGSIQKLALKPNPVPIAERIQDQTIGRPGVVGANVEFDATHEGGQGVVAIDGGSLTFPGVFDKTSIELQTLKANLGWKVSKAKDPDAAPDVTVTAKSVQFANADAQGSFDGTWRNGAGSGVGAGRRYPGVIDLQGKLSRARVTAVSRYLPLGIGPAVRDYVAHAFNAGTIRDATVKVRGDLFAFPYQNKQGEFRFVGKVEGVQMNIAPQALTANKTPQWPLFDALRGEVVFDRTSMQIRQASGQLYGLSLRDGQGEVADFANEPTLAITGVASGPAADMLRFVNASPVGGWIGQALAQTTVSGNADLSVALNAPLRQLQDTTVRGVVTLRDNDLRIRPDVPLMAGARGSVEFTEKVLAIKEARATVHGGEAVFDGGTGADGTLQFNGRGVITAQGFAGATELGPITRLAAAMKGQTNYQLSLVFHGPQPEFTVISNLEGMAFDAPAPLGKAAATSLPLRVQTQLLATTPSNGDTSTVKGKPRRDVLSVGVGALFQARYVRDIGGAEPKVLAGGIGVGADAPQPDAGVHAIVNASFLDVDAWQAFGEKMGIGFGSPKSASPQAQPSVAAAKAVADSSPYAPSAVALTAQELLFDSRRMTKVTAGLTQQGADGTWRANLDADQVAGFVQWRPAAGGKPPHLQARFARLSLPASAAESVDAMLTDDAPPNPPTLDIVVDDFELKGRKLGRVEIDATHEALAGDAHSWRLNQLRVSNPEAQLTGNGTWVAPSEGKRGRRMVVNFKLELRDSGAYLNRFGFKDVIRGGQGVMAGQVSWAGSPLTWHAPSLAGNINLDLDEGQFLKANTGAARLLSVLSLQSLPRRLLLDFRDFFADGFSFDTIKGDVVLNQGQATTKNMRMRGVQAAVLMEGSADITRETQDLQVWVVPEINAGAASLVYAAINPAIGLGTFLAQLFLRKPLMEAGTRQFHVRGSWADPQVDRIDRRTGDRIPELDNNNGPSTLQSSTPAAAPAASATPSPPLATPAAPPSTPAESNAGSTQPTRPQTP